MKRQWWEDEKNNFFRQWKYNRIDFVFRWMFILTCAGAVLLLGTVGVKENSVEDRMIERVAQDQLRKTQNLLLAQKAHMNEVSVERNRSVLEKYQEFATHVTYVRDDRPANPVCFAVYNDSMQMYVGGGNFHQVAYHTASVVPCDSVKDMLVPPLPHILASSQ